MSAPVAINARAAARREIGGVERWARELAVRLPRLAPDRYRVLRPPEQLAHRAGHAWEQVVLPLRARGAELILSPANLAPVTSGRNAVVIHDLAPFREPGWYGEAYARYHRSLARALARRARLVIAVSRFARGEIVDLLGVEPSRVAVVPGGVGERFAPGLETRAVRERYELGRPYVLAVGTDIARKNLAVLAEAAERLDREGIELVAAGSSRTYMRGAAGEPLRRLGYVADGDLPALYSGALALAMPSLYEGFGLPCLEAMASGVPVVAADRAALPETCGDAALLVDPSDRAGLAAALLSAATDEGVRERLIPAGLERAAGFGWQRAAELMNAEIARLLA